MHFWSHNSPAAPPVNGQPLQTQGNRSASSLTDAIQGDYLHFWHSHGTEIDSTEQGKGRRKEGEILGEEQNRSSTHPVSFVALFRTFYPWPT